MVGAVVQIAWLLRTHEACPARMSGGERMILTNVHAFKVDAYDCIEDHVSCYKIVCLSACAPLSFVLPNGFGFTARAVLRHGVF